MPSPPVEAEAFLAPPHADEVDAAIFAAHAYAAKGKFHGHPSARAEMLLAPNIEVQAKAVRTFSEQKIIPLEGLSGKAHLAITASQRARAPERAQPFG